MHGSIPERVSDTPDLRNQNQYLNKLSANLSTEDLRHTELVTRRLREIQRNASRCLCVILQIKYMPCKLEEYDHFQPARDHNHLVLAGISSAHVTQNTMESLLVKIMG